VWATEQKTISKRLGSTSYRGRAAVVFFGSVAAYGVVAQLIDPGLTVLWSLTIVVSLMHFWYDGFVWSVRKKQI
jgi:hypothetical protein